MREQTGQHHTIVGNRSDLCNELPTRSHLHGHQHRRPHEITQNKPKFEACQQLKLNKAMASSSLRHALSCSEDMNAVADLQCALDSSSPQRTQPSLQPASVHSTNVANPYPIIKYPFKVTSSLTSCTSMETEIVGEDEWKAIEDAMSSAHLVHARGLAAQSAGMTTQKEFSDSRGAWLSVSKRHCSQARNIRSPSILQVFPHM
jgi:hypothetical protein